MFSCDARQKYSTTLLGSGKTTQRRHPCPRIEVGDLTFRQSPNSSSTLSLPAAGGLPRVFWLPSPVDYRLSQLLLASLTSDCPMGLLDMPFGAKVKCPTKPSSFSAQRA